MTASPPLDLRDRFFLPEEPGAVELRAFTHGLMPRTVPAMMDRFVTDWQQRGVDAWNRVPDHWRPEAPAEVGWWDLPEYLGDAFVAPLLRAPAGSCILQPHVHWVVQCLLSAPEVAGPDTEVVVTELAFPSVLHSVRRWAELRGYALRVVPAGTDGFVDRAALLEAVTDRTSLVVVSHVGFTTGERLPDAYLRHLADRAHDAGALLAVDGYHATASVPVDVGALDADLYFGGLLKEACGSSGNAYLYVRPGLSLTPRLTGWFGDARPFAFDAAPQPHPDVRRRFMGGTTAVASLYHAVEGLRVLLDVGIEAVHADSLYKTAYAIERAEAAGLTLRSPRADERRSAMLVFGAPDADRLCAVLKTRGIYTDSRRGRTLRMAPFVWNTMDEAERAMDALAEELRAGTYRDAPAPTSEGPVT